MTINCKGRLIDLSSPKVMGILNSTPDSFFEDSRTQNKSDILKKNIRLNVANAALRTVDFKGGLDKYLLSAKNSKLSRKVKKIKAFISSKA